MGILISRFRKKKNTIEELEEIEQKIKNIEKFQKETEQQFRRVIGKLVIFSILIYVVALCVYYYYFSPETFRENILKFMPLLVFPVMILISRKLLSWYYVRKLSKNETALKSLKSNKKKILDEVMDKEIYKVAKEILEKYAPEQLNKDSSKIVLNNNGSVKAIMPASPIRTDTTARHRVLSTSAHRKIDTPLRLSNAAFNAVPDASLQRQPKLSLPRPIISKDRGAFDKLVDMIIGDGPSNRYALICRVCSSHNGMALKHEFEYLAFRCAYCQQWNPARKQKPQAPNLSMENGSQDDSDVNNSETDEVNTTKAYSEPFDVIKESTNISKDVSELMVNSKMENETSNDTNIAASIDAIDMSELRNALEELKSENVQPILQTSPLIDSAEDENEKVVETNITNLDQS